MMAFPPKKSKLLHVHFSFMSTVSMDLIYIFSFLFGTGFYTLLHSDGARIQPSATKFLREQKSIDSEIGVQTVSL
jgi:uncharacterized membrane protein YeiB